MSTDRVKIQFVLDPKDGHGYETEGLWGESLGAGEFRILNSPFFAFGISFDDVVKAESSAGVYRFQEVLRRGGHSTYRLFLQNDRTVDDPEFKEYWTQLRRQHCTYENANDHFVAVDVPPQADVSKVYSLLEKGEAEGVWVFEEGHY